MSDPEKLMEEIDRLGGRLAEAKAAIATRIIGQEEVVNLALAAMLSGGHALLMGLPGMGKTLLVDTLSKVMGLSESRIQFTPDLMPADILGSEVLETGADGARSFRFIEGPVFCQLLMADEINRASPRTQSALLQAMQEMEVTVAGVHHALPRPFHVLATQNPIEQEGTYPLPEAQLDRISIGARAGARLASGRDVVGEVIFLSRSGDETTRTFRLEIEVANSDLSIRDGQTADILVEADGQMAHLLPQSALTLDDDGRLGVRTVGDGNRAAFVPVSIIRDTIDGVWVAGLEEVVDIIIVGQEFVTDGVRVEPTFRGENG